MLTGARDKLAALLQPHDAFEARARLDQLYAIANVNIEFALFSAIIAVMVAVIDLQWVSPTRISIWLITVLASLGWMYRGSRMALSRERGPQDAGHVTLESIAWNAPFMLVWSTMVLYVWIPGNVLNNGFLVTFVFASMAASVPQSGLCRYVALPGMVVDLALLATHPLSGSVLMDWFVPGLQTLAGLLICKLSFTFERTYRTVAFQRFEKEAMAQELTRTADELSRARDFAQEASKAKSEFLANMSHELRTPLNAIIGFSDMIRTEMLGPVQPAKYADYIGDIHKSGLHLLNLINNLLDLAKIEAGKQDLQDVEIALDQTAANALRFVENQARKGGISLSTEIDAGLGLVADERAITQVLTNLLSNAIKFTQPGGDVAVFAHRVDGGGLALGVKDTGIGMEPDEVRRALEPFVQIAHVTTVEGWGTGLGVPLVKALIEIHGGTFHIESHRGIGTCAWGEFPAIRTAAVPQVSLAS